MPPLAIFGVALALVIGAILLLRVHAFLALLGAAALVAVLTAPSTLERAALERGLAPEAAATLAGTPAGERVAASFGRTAGQIGLLIVMASIIGATLLDSGGADRIVRFALGAVGTARAPAAFLGSGFLLSIPVFFDTVFFMLIPLVKATRIRSGGHYIYYLLAVIAGGTMTHSLVPPTPGPLFIAAELGVNLATMAIGGCLVGGCAAAAGYLYAGWMDRRWPVPLRDPAAALAELERLGSGRRTAVMCAEADWHHCHRRMVSDALVARGGTVLHLRETGALEPHELPEFAAVNDGRVTYPAAQTSLDL